MNHRDEIILKKVLSEVNVAADMMKGCSLADFLDNEMLKRAVCMTVINVGELVKILIVGYHIRKSHGRILLDFGISPRTSTKHCAWKTFTKQL